MPVDVGVMPILDMSATINMALSRNGCVMDRELCRLISRNWLFPNQFAAKDSDGTPFDMFYDCLLYTSRCVYETGTPLKLIVRERGEKE